VPIVTESYCSTSPPEGHHSTSSAESSGEGLEDKFEVDRELTRIVIEEEGYYARFQICPVGDRWRRPFSITARTAQPLPTIRCVLRRTATNREC